MPTRGTTKHSHISDRHLIFQSTCPRGARLFDPSTTVKSTYFNPRAHEGHDSCTISHSNMTMVISIHVPTRGTTGVSEFAPSSTIISIHVPTRGTTDTNVMRTYSSDFNPRAHEGHDLKMRRCRSRYFILFQSTCPRGARHPLWSGFPFPKISIHVPTRGTTRRPDLIEPVYYISIHVPTRGTTCRMLRYPHLISISIHVPTRGTTFSARLEFYPDDFNPRAHEGHDEEMSNKHHWFDISIHVPTRGTTLFLPSIPHPKKFQSTCPRGARPGSIVIISRWKISIHVPTRGTTC